MSLVEPAEVTAQVSSGVETDTLQSIIDREEAWLARRVGGLSGERAQSFAPTGYTIRLPRTTDDVDVSGVDPANVVLSDQRYVTVAHWGSWPVVITYTPNDELEVKQAIIDLCRITLTNSPYNTESADVHSYTRGASPDSLREAIARRITHAGVSEPMTATVSFR
jgi:hypothetical protein